MQKFFQQLRMKPWIAIAAALIGLLAFLFPNQVGVLLLKACYVAVAIVIGYYADRVLFPYARPHEVADKLWKTVHGHNTDMLEVKEASLAFAAAQIRRALIVLAVILGFSLGL